MRGRIMVRLPNWLGDMVMSSAFMARLHALEPQARIEVIAKKGLEAIAERLPGVSQVHAFSKSEHKGLIALARYGRGLKGDSSIERFFCLPDSFSSAWMARFSGAKERIGYRGQGRNALLTTAMSKESGQHRASEYLALLEARYEPAGERIPLSLDKEHLPPLPEELHAGKYLVLNLNSVAQSRRMPQERAGQVINALQQEMDIPLVMIGGPNEVETVEAMIQAATSTKPLINLAGKTRLPELMTVLAQAKAVVSTDSGPAHLAHALGAPLLVFFGAGDERNTGPYSPHHQQVLRVTGLECAPCLKNTCKFGSPKCLNQLWDPDIIQTLQSLLASA